ncbi:hypothetical protein QE152_g26671 [Popillia japonica]|uniref:Uncharacterized protein n=1 Tax=Popillia japonica TaxID=7064 RepID=A0AAW1JY35_POPJA
MPWWKNTQSLSKKTIQNIVDQKRTILTKNRIPTAMLEQIRKEVSIELGLTVANNQQQIVVEEIIELGLTVANNQQQIVVEEINTQTVSEIEEGPVARCFMQNKIKFDGIDAGTAQKLPRLTTNKRTSPIIKDVNDLLLQNATECRSLSDMHQLISGRHL